MGLRQGHETPPETFKQAQSAGKIGFITVPVLFEPLLAATLMEKPLAPDFVHNPFSLWPGSSLWR